MRACIDCHALTTTGPRCDTCATTSGKPQGTTTQRGYGYAHQKMRATYQARMNAGETFTCPRCLTPILPGQAWDLEHEPGSRDTYDGPGHATCNRRTA